MLSATLALSAPALAVTFRVVSPWLPSTAAHAINAINVAAGYFALRLIILCSACSSRKSFDPNEKASDVPATAYADSLTQLMMSTTQETATLGGGCFWCLEAVYRELRGVEKVVSGYAGGGRPNPTYEQVCAGVTGHAEVVQVTFDPEVISYRDLLDVFFTIHDPTTLNRQGNDTGTQYRSVIFVHSPEQERVAREAIAQLQRDGLWGDGAPIVTELAEAPTFYPAEEYHQEYFERNPRQPYCQFVVAPKVSKARSVFFEKLRESVR
jgi:peptide-methionine (S)-S-oxide reductase